MPVPRGGRFVRRAAGGTGAARRFPAQFNIVGNFASGGAAARECPAQGVAIPRIDTGDPGRLRHPGASGKAITAVKSADGSKAVY
jgi:hypothetical protein